MDGSVKVFVQSEIELYCINSLKLTKQVLLIKMLTHDFIARSQNTTIKNRNINEPCALIRKSIDGKVAPR